MTTIGGHFAETAILWDGNAYYIAYNNYLLKYSTTFQLLSYFSPTTHIIRKISFRTHSTYQVLILVNKRIILFDLQTQQPVSTFELAYTDSDTFFYDFIQYKENLIIALHDNKNNQSTLVSTPIKPYMNKIDLQNPLFCAKLRFKCMSLFDDYLLLAQNQMLYSVSLHSRSVQTTYFKTSITSLYVNKHLIIGTQNGPIHVLPGLPREGVFDNQNMILDRHYDYILSMFYNFKQNTLYSAQFNYNSFGCWIRRDGYFVYVPVSTGSVYPLFLYYIGDKLFIHTTGNNIQVYNAQNKLIHTISSLPFSKVDTTYFCLRFNHHNYSVHYQSTNGCVFKTQLKSLKAAYNINLTNRDFYRCYNSTYNVELKHYDVSGDYIFAITKLCDESLIVYKNSHILYNLYNVGSDSIFIKSIEVSEDFSDVLILIGFSYGVKLFRIKNDQLQYLKFIRINELSDADIVKSASNEVFLHCLASDNIYYKYYIAMMYGKSHAEMAFSYISIFQISQASLQQHAFNSQSTYSLSLSQDDNKKAKVEPTFKSQIVACQNNILIKVENQLYCINYHQQFEKIQIKVDSPVLLAKTTDEIYIFCNNYVFYLTRELKLAEMCSLYIKQKVMAFCVTSTYKFVIFFYENKSGYFFVYSDKKEENEIVEEAEYQYHYNYGISAALLTSQQKNSENEQLEGNYKIAFRSTFLSYYLASGRDVFSDIVE